MLKIIGFLVGGVPSLVKAIGGQIIAYHASTAERQEGEDRNGAVLAANWLTSVVETNKIKAETQTERRVLFAILMFAVPVGIHWWAVCLDSIPFYLPFLMDESHVVGSWHVSARWDPAWVETYHKIIDSFFISAPAIAGASILARAFRRN
jgi:hypothetical protein